jgi:hypothetical protein
LLVDPLVNDVEALATINRTLIASGITAGEDQPKVVPYIFVAARTPNRIGEIAQECTASPKPGVDDRSCSG